MTKAYLGWRAKDGTDLEKLIDLTAAREEGAQCVEFCHDAAQCPDVNGRAVAGGAQQHLRGTVPATPTCVCLQAWPVCLSSCITLRRFLLLRDGILHNVDF